MQTVNVKTFLFEYLCYLTIAKKSSSTYNRVFVVFSQTELPKTKEEYEEKLIFKSFFLKSMNAFAPIFYVAFFKGRCVSSRNFMHCTSLYVYINHHVTLSSYRFAGRPGDYFYVFEDYRMEEVGFVILHGL